MLSFTGYKRSKFLYCATKTLYNVTPDKMITLHGYITKTNIFNSITFTKYPSAKGYRLKLLEPSGLLTLEATTFFLI